MCCGFSLPQATLASLRIGLESSQSSLFEFTTRQEQAACANNASGLLPHDCFPVLQFFSFAPQATLVSLRSELESSQSTLFEFTTRQEQAAGSASTAEQLAVEEVERLSADLLTLRKDKALLERQLQALQQQQQSDGAGAGVNLISQCLSTVGGGLAGADAAVASNRQHKQRQQQQQASAAAEAALAAAEEAARDQQHQIALLTTKLAAAEGRLERVTGELARRPAAAAVAAMADQLAALSALTGVLWGGVLGLGASVLWCAVQGGRGRRRGGGDYVW